MKYILFLSLVLSSSITVAGEEYRFQATVIDHYVLTKNGFDKGKPANEAWTIVFKDNKYSLMSNDASVPLSILQVDENTISLSQSVLFSGHRIFTFFRKTKKFVFQETGYSDFAELRIVRGEMPENISLSYGTYTIE